MLNLREYRENPDRLADLLPWAAFIAPGVILNKDGSFQATIRYRGPDLDSSTESELVSVSARLNNALKRLGSGWVIYVEAQRIPSRRYPRSEWNDPLSLLIDEERRVLFESDAHYESHYYLTFVYLPPSDSASRIAGFFIESEETNGVNYRHTLNTFQTEVSRIATLLRGVFPEVHPLSDDETLTYLHSTISSKKHRVGVPETPMYLDAILADTPLIAGLEPKLGNLHLRTVTVLGFPGRSQPGLFDALNRLSIEYRWVTRFIALDKTAAETEIKKYKRQWFAKRKGILTLLKEAFTSSESIMEDSDAVNKAVDADAAQQELADDAVSYGYFTACVVVWDTDTRLLETKILEVERAINGLGFTTILESVNAVDAWLGTLPGNCRNNIRRPLLNTLNLAHLMPLSAVWAGPEQNDHFGAPPLLHAVTSGSTPFRLVTHVGDVGHTMITGPTGAGKSVLLNVLETQFLRYQNAQVYIFDKGGSARTLTAGVGGDYYDLAADDSPLAFQPLSHIDNDAERKWAQEWVLDILRQENVTVTPEIKNELWTALSSLATAPRDQRTLFGLTVLLQNTLLRQALKPYTLEGAHGHLLDSTSDNLRYGHWQCFEMEVLMETPAVVMPVLSYLFHRLEQRFDGRPTLLVLDEAWIFMDHPAFAAKIREWLKVLRKANVSVVFATQSMADVDASSIVATIKEACLTKIYLPNPAALDPDMTALYRKFSINDRQIQILATAQQRRHYYYTSPLGNRLFELGLDEVTLAYCAGTSKENQLHVQRLIRATDSSLEFNAAYLRSKGIEWAADYIESLMGKGMERGAGRIESLMERSEVTA